MNIEDLLEILYRNRRSSSVAEYVSGRSEKKGSTSCMAGGFFARPGENWPTNENGPMLPLIQIVFAEVPFVPACLADFSILPMFLDRAGLPMDSPVTDQESDEWAIRVYRPGDVLIPLQEPDDLWSGEYGEDRAHFAFDKQFPPRVTRIDWRRSDADRQREPTMRQS